MSAAGNAQTHANRVLTLKTTDEKIDELARAVSELARAVKKIEANVK